MRIAGIIAEYNPFHNGHAWHIAETRRMTGCDYVVASMAGHFTQRGDPAILSKWARARMALACGADAVVELPAMFAVRPADAFARGGVMTLGGLGVDVLSFGSETDDLGLIATLVGIVENEPKSVSDTIKRRLDLGEAYPRARGEAIEEALGLPAGTTNRPNLTLAVEYARAVKTLYPDMALCAVRRRGEYHDSTTGPMASATAIRSALARGDMQTAMMAIPDAARPYFRPDAMHAMDDMLMMRLRDMTEGELCALPEAAEGLDRRLWRLCRTHSSRDALVDALKCKRYTRARLCRMLTQALIGMTREMIANHPVPTYARLIGARRGAEPLLTELSRRAQIPVAASPQSIREDPIFALECRATDLWALMHDRPEERLPGREFTEKFIRV